MITINQQPQSLTPAYNKMIYHVSSNNTAQDNFKFICDIYIDGAYIRREKRSKHPDFNACIFDVHRIVESFVTHTLGSEFPEACSNLIDDNWCSVVCKFGEEYGLSSTGVTVYPDLQNSSGTYAFNGAVNESEYIDWDGSDYLMNSSGSLFLMTLPNKTVMRPTTGIRGNTILRNQNYFAYAHTEDSPFIDRLVISTYDVNHNLIDEYQVEQTRIGAKFMMFPIGYNANLIDAGNFVTGSPPVYTDSVYSSRIYLVDASNNQISEEIWLRVIDRCSPYESFEVHWMDRLGAINTFIFDNASNENDSIDRNEYRIQPGTMASDSFTLSKSDRGKQSFFTASQKELRLKSDWITQNEYDWLKYIKESPQVWIYQGGEYIAMNVKDTSYESKKTANTTLINLELTLDYSQKNHRQRY